MVENKASIDSIKSFIYEDEEHNLSITKEPQTVQITVRPDENVRILETNPTEFELKGEIPYIAPAIEEALNFDFKNAANYEIIANNEQLRNLLCRTTELINEKTKLSQNLEKQIKTLELETKSLKDLLAITKEILSTRNLEVLNLNNEIRNMEELINSEKEKHKNLLLNMNEAVDVITKMKEEHKLQMDLAVELQEGYKKKIELLEKENKLFSWQLFEEPLLNKAMPVITEKAGEGDTMSSGSDEYKMK